MSGIDPKVGAYVGAGALVISIIAVMSPTVFPSYVPASLATGVISTCAFLNILLNGVNTYLHLYSAPIAGPAVK
jgi:hypothetical protein